MDTVDSIQKLCQRLICFAFHRCRVVKDLCRISIVFHASHREGSAPVRISISDTGVCSSLEEFLRLKFLSHGSFAAKWDEVLAVRSTGISDEVVHSHELNLKEVTSTGKLNRLPSIPKNGMKFSGTEVCLSVKEKLGVLLDDVNHFFGKMLILNIPNIAFVVLVHGASGPCYENAFIPKGYNMPISASTVECLRSGFEDYVLKNTSGVAGNSSSCSINMENLRTGVGMTRRAESFAHGVLVMDAVVTLCDSPNQTDPSPMECCSQTEVMYFKDFCPSPVPESSLTTLSSLSWKSYGLRLASVTNEGGRAFLKWENFPPNMHIAVVFHFYQEKISYPLARHKAVSNKTLMKKAGKLAFDDLKEKHKGVFLSDHALKIRSYAPDLANTLAGLIQTSSNSNFREQCLSLLGLGSSQDGGEAVEECIKEKIISVIELNDRKPEVASAPFLFEVERPRELNVAEECEEGDYAFDSFDP